MDLAETLKTDKIQHLRLHPPLCVALETPLTEVIKKMQEKKTGCVVVVQSEKLVGIFTERDAMKRVLGKGIALSTAIEKVMTQNPTALKTDDSVATAIRVMDKGGYRRVPLVDEADRVIGILSVRNVVRYLAEHFPFEVYNLPPDPRQVNRAREGA